MTDKTEWVMVPSKWTPEMLQAAINYGGWRPERWQETWNQVLAAAPTPPAQDALMCDVLNMRAVMQRMVAGIKHLAEIARQWEPDHSSGADRRGWLLALEAADDAKALLDAQAKRLLIPKSQEMSK